MPNEDRKEERPGRGRPRKPLQRERDWQRGKEDRIRRGEQLPDDKANAWKKRKAKGKNKVEKKDRPDEDGDSGGSKAKAKGGKKKKSLGSRTDFKPPRNNQTGMERRSTDDGLDYDKMLDTPTGDQRVDSLMRELGHGAQDRRLENIMQRLQQSDQEMQRNVFQQPGPQVAMGPRVDALMAQLGQGGVPQGAPPNPGPMQRMDGLGMQQPPMPQLDMGPPPGLQRPRPNPGLQPRMDDLLPQY